ncbi:15-hydroxyprostaglandin dehydrogenase [NAD(+)]-like [Anticarsia gemmatalis]|uniref:15-hydroxyprostaglandin dehydrogenase [NAD(+)]-like n=1 Tax=Anticarsia gemmatalis TaxID=129554 RepID=UPI003F774C55
MYNLKDKVVIITGAAKGIGAAVCAQMLREGAKHVSILDVNEISGVQLRNTLNEQYGANKVKFIRCDVTNHDQLFDAFENTQKEHCFLDVVINNAGLVNESNYNAIRKQVDVNYIAVVNGTLRALELMDKTKNGRGGTIINISSVAGLYPACPPLFIYSSTKAAVLQFTSCIGMEPLQSNTGVRVIALCYGSTDTNIFANMSTFEGKGDQQVLDIVDDHINQSIESAVTGTLEAYKKGTSSSIWLIHDNKPARDITKDVAKCHQQMAALLGR